MAHNPRFKRENNLHTQNWMVENDEPLPTLWYTKMAHTQHILHIYRPPIVEFAMAVFLVQFSLSKMLVLNSFWGFVAHNPKLKGGRNHEETFLHNWMVENDEPLPTLWYTKMAHTHSIYCIYKDPQLWNLQGLPLLVQFSFSKMLVLNNF